MSDLKHDKPHFELARLYQDGSRETERVELCDLPEVLKRGSHLKMARRGFIGLSTFSTTALLVACGALPGTPSASSTPTPPPVGHTRGGGVVVREGPGSEYNQILVLPAGATFIILARDDASTWFEIRLPDGTIGWVLVSEVVLNSPVSMDSLPVGSAAYPPPTPTSTPTPTPTPEPSPTPTQEPSSGTCTCNQIGVCTCNEICTCIPVPVP